MTTDKTDHASENLKDGAPDATAPITSNAIRLSPREWLITAMIVAT